MADALDQKFMTDEDVKHHTALGSDVEDGKVRTADPTDGFDMDESASYKNVENNNTEL